MAKKKISIKQIPQSYLVLGIASLILNGLFIVVVVVASIFEATGLSDYTIVNSGIDRMCSSEFRERVSNDAKSSGDSSSEIHKKVALVDFPCSNNGADKYYQDGYKAYTKSLGL